VTLLALQLSKNSRPRLVFHPQGQERNSFLFSMELSVYSAITLAARTYFTAQSSSGDEASDGDKIMSLGFFHAWHLSTVLPILSNCEFGMLLKIAFPSLMACAFPELHHIYRRGSRGSAQDSAAYSLSTSASSNLPPL